MSHERAEEPGPIFPKLTGRDARQMGSERVAAHQRGRLMGAMLAAVDEGGYPAVTVEMVVALAGVSKSAFYREFSDREECFLATFDEIVGEGARQIEAAYLEAEGVPARLRAAFESFLALATDAGPAARFVFLASLDVGPAALAARERAAEPFQKILTRSFVDEGEEAIPDLVVRAIVGGTHEIVYRRLREGEPGQLSQDMEALIDWGLSYRGSVSGHQSLGARLLEELGPRALAEFDSEPEEEIWNWEDPADDDRARAVLSQRERILRATAQVAVEKGYGGLSVSRISGRAGTSNQTFYENFGSKDEAFFDAFDTLAMRSFNLTATAFESQEERIQAGAAGMVAMLGHLARDPLHRRLSFIELSAAGRTGLERAEAMLEVFIGLLEPATFPPEVRRRPPKVVLEAIGGGIWAIVRQEIIAGRGDQLLELTAQLIDFSLAPFDVQLGRD